MSSASIPDDVPATDSEPTISLISTQQPFASPSPSTAHNMPVPVVRSQQLQVKAEEKAALGLGAEIPLAMRFPSSPSSPPPSLPFPSLVGPFPHRTTGFAFVRYQMVSEYHSQVERS